jgi:hypothetical protein
MGKAYTNRKPRSKRPESDFYRTPEGCTQALLDSMISIPSTEIYEPMAGDGAIASVLSSSARGYTVRQDDIRTTGKDFLEFSGQVPYILTNPAFSIFTETVEKCRECTEHGFILLGKLNFFGAHSRTVAGTWKNLKHVYIFDRQVDYRTPPGQDGHFCVGNLVTGWFVWDKAWNEPYWRTSVLDVQKWATLGSYEAFTHRR